jgi:uncharacterized membrane protein YgaE (UPF0421/DUF939 family)
MGRLAAKASLIFVRSVILGCVAGGLAAAWALLRGGGVAYTVGGALVIVAIVYLVIGAGGVQPQNIGSRIVSRGSAGPTIELPNEAGAPPGWSLPLCVTAVVLGTLGVVLQQAW